LLLGAFEADDARRVPSVATIACPRVSFRPGSARSSSKAAVLALARVTRAKAMGLSKRSSPDDRW